MNRSKRKERKRREEYNKAVKHKMESAANLADKYSRVYDYSEKTEKAKRKKNNRVVKRKLFYSSVTVILYSFVLVAVVVMVFLPFRKFFKDVFENYFADKKPEFSSTMVINEFTGSINEIKPVSFTDIEQPEKNACYAEISSLFIKGEVYYGISDQALIQGLCQDEKTDLPGFGKPILLTGYNSVCLENIEKAKKGSVITLTTNYGVYEYKVCEIGHFENGADLPYDTEEDAEKLIICTDYGFDEEKMDYTETYYIIAEKVSGPEVIY